MRKPVIIVLAAIVTIGSVISIGRLTNILVLSKITSGANEPSMKADAWIWSSNLAKPGRYDFICFRSMDMYGDKMTRVFRVYGLPGDKIEIRAGSVYVNDHPADSILLNYHYIVPLSGFNKIDEDHPFSEDSYSLYGRDSVSVFTNEQLLQQYGVKARRLTYPADVPSESIEAVYKQTWNKDNFGPLFIPASKYFVLGDNWDNAEDSRYLGLIDHSDYLSTVFYY